MSSELAAESKITNKPKEHLCEDIQRLFQRCFEGSHNTVLIGGYREPLYRPACEDKPRNQVMFTQDYYASALHETAHWLVAGEARRSLEDYGYWYAPDGRNAEEQAEFEKVEAKPQALECILCRAAGFPFKVSVDNLNAELQAAPEFYEAIYQQIIAYCHGLLNQRSVAMINTIAEFYGTGDVINPSLYRLDQIR